MTVLDFGISKTAETGLTRPGTVLGTPTFMSPEQARALPLDKRSDLYSVAAMVFELVSGAPPFSGDDSGSVMQMHVDAPAPRITSVNPELPAALDEVMLKALHKDPTQRYQTAQSLWSALDSAFSGAGKTFRLYKKNTPIVPALAAEPEPDEAEGMSTASAGETRLLRRGRGRWLGSISLAKGWLLGAAAVALGAGLAAFALWSTPKRPTKTPPSAGSVATLPGAWIIDAGASAALIEPVDAGAVTASKTPDAGVTIADKSSEPPRRPPSTRKGR